MFSLSSSRLCSVLTVLLPKGVPLQAPGFGGEKPLGPYSRWGLLLPFLCTVFAQVLDALMGRERAVCPPIAELPPAWLPVSQGRKGSEAFIPLLWSCVSGAEKSVLWQHLRRPRWRFWSSPTLSFSNYSNFKKIFLCDRNNPYGVVWVGNSCRSSAGSSCSCSASSVNLFRRISVLDVAGADVSSSLLVLWTCKLGDPLLPLWNNVCCCTTTQGCFGSHTAMTNVSKVWLFLLVIKLPFSFPLCSSGSYTMQSRFSDCQGTRNAKNGRCVLALLRRSTEQGRGGAWAHPERYLGIWFHLNIG